MGVVITASMLYSYVTCPHRVTLDLFGDPAERDEVSPFVELLWERGHAFERETIDALGEPYLNLRDVSRDEREGLTVRAMAHGEGLIYGGRISHRDLLGEPDLLRKTEAGYIPGDIKSGAGLEGRREDVDGKPKKPYALQLALYSDILQQSGWGTTRNAFVWDIHGDEVAYPLEAPRGPRTGRTMWEEYQEALADVSSIVDRTLGTKPGLIGACSLCPWRTHCWHEVVRADDPTLISQLGPSAREKFPEALQTVQRLADAPLDRLIVGGTSVIPGIGAKTLRMYHARAVLQKESNGAPYFTEPVDLPTAAVELFFDVETDPFRDLCYLHGFVCRDGGRDGTETYEAFTADEATPERERDAFAAAWDYVRARPDAVVYYYSPYERTTWKKLAARYPEVATEEDVLALFDEPRFIDLYHDVVRSKMVWPTHSLSIKTLATFLGFHWRDMDPSGAASVQWFHDWVETGDPQIWARILEYNEDDCRAMRVLADALRRMGTK